VTQEFFCFNHQGKADAFIQALTARGWTQTKQSHRYDGNGYPGRQ